MNKLQQFLSWTMRTLGKAVIIVILLNALLIGAWIGFDLIIGYMTEVLTHLDKSVIIIK